MFEQWDLVWGDKAAPRSHTVINLPSKCFGLFSQLTITDNCQFDAT